MEASDCLSSKERAAIERLESEIDKLLGTVSLNLMQETAGI